MSKLSAFLHPVTTSEEKEVVISNRFQDESGQPVPFKIRALTQEENDAITRQATRRRKEGGQTIEQLDSVDFTRRMVVAARWNPTFPARSCATGAASWTRCWCPVNCCCPASMPGWSRRLRSCPALRSRRMR